MNSRKVVSTAVLSFLLVVPSACNRSRSGLSSAHTVAIQDSVRTALDAFRRYAGAARWDSLAAVYSPDSRFRWIEEGRRGGPAGLHAILASLPPGLRFATNYDSTEIVALAPGIASVTAYYRTRFIPSSPPVSFAGGISMVWVHEPSGWRIIAGHSSLRSPAMPPLVPFTRP